MKQEKAAAKSQQKKLQQQQAHEVKTKLQLEAQTSNEVDSRGQGGKVQHTEGAQSNVFDQVQYTELNQSMQDDKLSKNINNPQRTERSINLEKRHSQVYIAKQKTSERLSTLGNIPSS